MLKKPPKMPKNPNFGTYFEHFTTLFCQFDALHSAENLGGIEQFFLYVSLQNMKKYNIFMPGMHGTPCHHYKSKPLKPSTNARGVVKTQILPKICCQILHLCISYINKSGFTHCAMVKY